MSKGRKFKFCQDVPFISDEYGKPVDIGSPDRIFKLPQIDLGSPSVTNRNVLPSILNSSKSPS